MVPVAATRALSYSTGNARSAPPRTGTVDEVVFAEKGDFVLLGARALEGLLLWVDPKNKKLIEIEAHPVAKVVVPGKAPPDKDKPLRTGKIIQGEREPASPAHRLHGAEIAAGFVL